MTNNHLPLELEIEFDDKALKTVVYIKMDAQDQLLASFRRGVPPVRNSHIPPRDHGMEEMQR